MDLQEQFIAEDVVDHSAFPGVPTGLDDYVIGHCTALFVRKGDFLRIPATGKQTPITGIDICRYRDGKIVEMWHQLGIRSLLESLGVVPAPFPAAAVSMRLAEGSSKFNAATRSSAEDIAMTKNIERLAILCGGGPAPGINSVIGAATIRTVLEGVEVLGIRDGFKWLMQGDIGHVVPLSIEDVSRIHFTGGSYLGISRANPTTDVRHLQAASDALVRLGVDGLITIGGDDTAFSAMRLAAQSAGRLRVVHVPKTIDNDLDLPHGISTFGFQTARHVGVEILENLMVDARTTGRWYLLVTMGRKAGHLALGIGKAAGATLTIIPEEFQAGPIRLDDIADILVGAIVKRLSAGHVDGTAVLAEGLVERLPPDDLASFGQLERDEHEHLRLGEVDLGHVVKERVRNRLAEFGLATTLVSKDIGYELRCANPIPFDMEYTRDLGYCAATYLLEGGRDAMATLVDGHFEPMPFTQMLDPETGRTRVRLVDTGSEHYRVARHYMVRLNRADLEDPHAMARLADVVGLAPEAFRGRFRNVVATEPSEQLSSAT